jgi:hypothetical protein
MFIIYHDVSNVVHPENCYRRRRNVDLSSHTANTFSWMVVCNIQNLYLETSISILRMPVISSIVKKRNLSHLIFDQFGGCCNLVVANMESSAYLPFEEMYRVMLWFTDKHNVTTCQHDSNCWMSSEIRCSVTMLGKVC